MKVFGGRKRLIPEELDLTKVDSERIPGSRAHIKTVAVPDSAATPGPSRRDRPGMHIYAVVSLWMALPLAGWLAVCLATDASAVFTLATCAVVLLLTAGTAILCRPAPQPRPDDTDRES